MSSSFGNLLRFISEPSAALQSFADSWRTWDEVRKWRQEVKERAQLSPSHAFTRLPNFFDRPAETKALTRALQEDPCFTVVFGGSSVGKTALLRQILCSPEEYHVLHFDLRISGFADIDSMYNSLSQQMEKYFVGIAERPGYGEFAKEAWRFKHDRIDVERRESVPTDTDTTKVKTSDIARLMEIFQSAMLKYREFTPSSPLSNAHRQGLFFRRWFSRKRKNESGSLTDSGTSSINIQVPVFLLDEAHKLPKLVKSVETMKCLLDAMLVLTKQDRLCHVIHSTSDPFYQTWLNEQNVMQHCKLITVGDCSKAETKAFFENRLLPSLREHQRSGLDFEHLYAAFGGRLVHWQDFIVDYDNTEGKIQIHNSSHYLQAYRLLNLLLIHSSRTSELAFGLRSRSPRVPPSPAYPPLNDSSSTPAPVEPPPTEPKYASSFTALQLLTVCSRLTQAGVRSLPYFTLCRELGPRAVDEMVRRRILDLRWMEPVTVEGEPSEFSARRRDDDEDEDENQNGDGENGSPHAIPATPIMRHAMAHTVREYKPTIEAYCEMDLHDACPPDCA